MAEAIATIKQGQLRGVTDTDLNGETYYKFLGIPFAKPPVGPLRFQPPQPAESWTGVRDATKEGSPCLAMDIMTVQRVGSEDCLNLNVFTKQLPKAGVIPKPVMVYIHGGGFTMGSNSEKMAGSKFLVAQDVVYVSINYRLGIFGFLSSDDTSLGVPGNMGLKDQTFALKWIQENISSFNGDPGNVTIFGFSAGGASVHFQVLSPSAKGLFHKAIAQSGSALNPWAWGQKNLIQVAEKLGAKVSDEKDALEALMNASGEELYEVSRKLPDDLLDVTRRRPFGPVIEKPNPSAFLTENPSDLLVSGKFNQVPLVIGCTSNEGLIWELKSEVLGASVKITELADFWSLTLEEKSQKRSEIRTKINEFYFKDGETVEAIHKIVGDLGFVIGVVDAAKLALEKSKNPIYFYVFSYELALTKILYKIVAGVEDNNFKGVAHGGDGSYLFSNQMSDNLEQFGPGIKEETLHAVRLVTKIWADFARTGRPHELWKPVTDIHQVNYFDIDKEPKLKVNPFAESVAVWEKVLKDLVPNGINAHNEENATV